MEFRANRCDLSSFPVGGEGETCRVERWSRWSVRGGTAQEGRSWQTLLSRSPGRFRRVDIAVGGAIIHFMRFHTGLILLAAWLVVSSTSAQTTSTNQSEMRRLTSRNTAAHRAAKQFLRGANLGNYMEAPPGQDWGQKYTSEDFVHIRAEGFDHVRLPIAWHHYAGPGPEFKLSAAIFAKADYLVTNALSSGLSVIANIHHFDAF